MLETLIHYDEQLTLGFHQALSSPFFDFLFGFLSNLWLWVPYFVFIALLVYLNDPKRAFLHWFFLVTGWFAAATVASFIHLFIFNIASLETAELLFRLRPGRTGTGVWHTTFPDPHTTSFAALSLYLWQRIARELKGLRWVFVLVPSLFFFANLYLAHSFLGDILFGILFGLLTGMALIIVSKGIENTFLAEVKAESLP